MSQDDAHYHNHQNAPKGLILHILPLTVILKHPVDTVKQKREYTAIYSQSTSEWSNIIRVLPNLKGTERREDMNQDVLVSSILGTLV